MIQQTLHWVPLATSKNMHKKLLVMYVFVLTEVVVSRIQCICTDVKMYAYSLRCKSHGYKNVAMNVMFNSMVTAYYEIVHAQKYQRFNRTRSKWNSMYFRASFVRIMLWNVGEMCECCFTCFRLCIFYVVTFDSVWRFCCHAPSSVKKLSGPLMLTIQYNAKAG